MLSAAAGASDERMMQLLRLLNRLLDKHPESRRRHLSFHTPAIVPVWMQVPQQPLAPIPTAFIDPLQPHTAAYASLPGLTCPYV